MKVICINDKPCYGKPTAPFIIKEGEIYEVINTWAYPVGKNWLWYELDIQKDVGYPVEFFIPISGISETEMERNYGKQLA